MTHAPAVQPPCRRSSPDQRTWVDPVAALIGDFYAERNREYPLGAAVFTAGSSPDNYLRIPDDRVARRHIRISRQGDTFVLEALSAERPTFLNHRRVPPGDRHGLRSGDRIRLSSLPFSFVDHLSSSAASRLVVLGGVHRGKRFRLRGSRARVGRAVENHVQFPDGFVSRRHCLLMRRSDGWWIRDLDSTNGTWIDRVPVRGDRRLEAGDEVRVGCSLFRIQEESGPSPIRQLAAAAARHAPEAPPDAGPRTASRGVAGLEQSS